MPALSHLAAGSVNQGSRSECSPRAAWLGWRWTACATRREVVAGRTDRAQRVLGKPHDCRRTVVLSPRSTSSKTPPGLNLLRCELSKRLADCRGIRRSARRLSPRGSWRQPFGCLTENLAVNNPRDAGAFVVDEVRHRFSRLFGQFFPPLV
jgi:hypothetical protein